MKKLLFLLYILFSAFTNASAQQDVVEKSLVVFPFQKSSEISSTLIAMESWGKGDWKKLLIRLDDDSLKLKSTYALNAFVSHVANDAAKKKNTASILSSGLSAVKSFYAKELIIQHLGLLGDDAAIKSLSKLLSDETFMGNAARALATIKSNASLAALQKALPKASAPAKKHIEAALDNVNKALPEISTVSMSKIIPQNSVQYLLLLQDQMDAAKNPVQKRRLLAEADRIPGFGSFMFVSKYLDDVEVKGNAARVAARLALADKNIRGPIVRSSLEKAIKLIRGEDSAILVKTLSAHIEAMPFENGFVSLFNGQDLTGWKGLVGNPISRSKMTPQELQEAQRKANESSQTDWVVKDGLLVFTGHGDNLATTKQYGDFEMYVDWKITEKGDAGIYLRGSPQVQIWDTSRREVGAQVGSGGLYNNQKNPSKPLTVADNKIGEWNTFHIIMKGEKVTVYLNGKLVTDNATLENYWDRKIPIFSKEQIELQAHGTYVAYRNIYLREITSDFTIPLSEDEKKQGFISLFDGSNIDQWVGNKKGYLVEEGALVAHPELGGGNIYTKDEYADFEYRFEFQLTPGANNGLGIRAPLKGDAAYVGMELQILDNEADIYKNLQPYQYHGSVYGVVPAKRGYLKPTGEWNQEEVIVKGPKVKVILNGQVIIDTDIVEAVKGNEKVQKEHPGLKNKTGHIGFLGHGDVVRFRNIRVKTL
jgi:hypothetical protein